MNRSDITPILADIDDTMSRVRDISASPGRSAALHCLAEAKQHLEAASEYRITARLVFPTAQVTRAELLETYPPPATDNQAVRNKATEAFRESRRILREVIK